MERVYYLVFGGDKRMSELATMLMDNGKIIAFDVKNRGINSVLCKVMPPNVVADESAAEGLLRGDLLVVGKAKEDLKAAVRWNGFRLFEMMKDGDFVEENANLTSEAALGILLSESEDTMAGKRVLVVGCGRIGRRLCGLCEAVGAWVDVCTSKPKLNSIYGRTVEFGDLRPELYDYVLNTAPETKLGKDFLKKLKTGAICCELASPPYGFDFVEAEKCKVKIVRMAALPAKRKAVAAAKIMYDYLEGLL